jgi:hypothetical protein
MIEHAAAIASMQRSGSASCPAHLELRQFKNSTLTRFILDRLILLIDPSEQNAFYLDYSV